MNFNFYVCFLAVFSASGVHLYADEAESTASASKLTVPKAKSVASATDFFVFYYNNMVGKLRIALDKN